MNDFYDSIVAEVRHTREKLLKKYGSSDSAA
jgi:hypothetical protein